jgi:hypothetical protein
MLDEERPARAPTRCGRPFSPARISSSTLREALEAFIATRKAALPDVSY